MGNVYQLDRYRYRKMINPKILDHLKTEFVTFPPLFTDSASEGIDLMAASRKNDCIYKLTVREDSQAFYSQKFFFPTQTIDRSPRLGWVFSSKSDATLLFIPQSDRLFWIDSGKLRSAVVKWLKQYSVVQEYTVGCLVPIAEVERIAGRSDFLKVKNPALEALG